MATRAEPTVAERLSNPEAEAALLGALLIDNRIIDLLPSISGEDFAVPVNGRIFEAIIKLRRDRGLQVDPAVLRPLFAYDPELQEVGGFAYIAGLTDISGGLIGARDFADQVVELARKRKLHGRILAAQQLLLDDPLTPAEELLSDLQQALWERPSARTSRFISSEQLVGIMRDRVSRVAEQGKPEGAICRSVPDLTDLLGPLEPGGYTIFAARPGIGKSVLATSAAWGFAANGVPVDYYFHEMSEEIFAQRYTADVAFAMREELPYKRLRRADLSQLEMAALDRVQERVKGLPVSFIDAVGWDIRDCEAALSRRADFHASKGRPPPISIFDHIGLILAAGRHRVGDIFGRANAVSKGLKSGARRTGQHIIALSQVRRDVENRADKRPVISDLRDSGELEQDADNVLLLYRHEYYMEQEERPAKDVLREAWEIDLSACRGFVELRAGKARLSQGGVRKCRYFGDNQAIRGSEFDRAPGLFSDTEDGDFFL